MQLNIEVIRYHIKTGSRLIWCQGKCGLLQAAKGAKTWEKAEDPIFALENNLPIDFQHYLEHHLSLPLTRIFGPIMRNPKSLLSGMAAVNDLPMFP